MVTTSLSKIYSRSSWNAQHRNGVGTRKVGKLSKYLHHTVTAHLPANASVAQEKAQMRVIERIGQQRFGGGISYNFIIFPSGRIYEGASVNRVSYHSGAGRNTRGVGICFAGNYDNNRPTDASIKAVVWLLQEGVRRGWWTDPALTEAHRDFKSTACPGRHLYRQFDNINRAGRSGQQEEKDWFDMATEADLRRIVREEIEKRTGNAVWSHRDAHTNFAMATHLRRAYEASTKTASAEEIVAELLSTTLQGMSVDWWIRNGLVLDPDHPQYPADPGSLADQIMRAAEAVTGEAVPPYDGTQRRN